MKGLLKILSVFTLVITSVSTSIATISDVSTFDNNYLEFNVDHDKPDQISPEYNMAANIQEIIRAKNSKAPSQRSLKRQFDELSTKEEFNNSVTKILNNYVYERDFSYFNKFVKVGFGTSESQKMLFQTAMIYSLSRGYPVMLYLEGRFLPWWDRNEMGFVFITIYSFTTEDYNDPGLTEYEVADPQGAPGGTAYLRPYHLARVLSEGAQLWMEGNVFDFERLGTTFNVDTSEASFNKKTDLLSKTISVKERANIFKTAGIYSFDWIKKFVMSITWNNSYLYFSWKEALFRKWQQSWFISKDSGNISDWQFIPRYSPIFQSPNLDETLFINTLIKFEYEPPIDKYHELVFSYRISWESSHGNIPSEFPYIGISMGNSWSLQWE